MSGTKLTTIPTIGPATEAAFHRAGIPDAETLRKIGADDAYFKLLQSGEKPHFVWYFALVMALQGRPWNDCVGDEKAALRVKFDAMKVRLKGDRVASPDNLPGGLEMALDHYGVRPKAK